VALSWQYSNFVAKRRSSLLLCKQLAREAAGSEVLLLAFQAMRTQWGIFARIDPPVRLDLQAGPRGLHERRAASPAQRSFSLHGISSSRLIRKSENPDAKTTQIYK
jgi:hypothetical protein